MIKYAYRSLSILALLVFVLFTAQCQEKNSDAPIVWKETVGTSDPHGYKQGTMRYSVDGVIYTGAFPGISDKDIGGERFTMRYNINDPSEIQIDSWNPIFVEGEVTRVFAAKVEKIQNANFFNRHSAIIYTYHVKGEKIERWRYLHPNYKQLYPNLKVGQYYEVEVLKENRYRSVLHLNRPMNNVANER